MAGGIGPHGGDRGGRSSGIRQVAHATRVYRTPRIPPDWRTRLPSPAIYYAERVQGLGRPNGAGRVQGRCPFHADAEASLSVRLDEARGGWRCFAGCGHGDLVAFHQRLTGLSFVDAVRDLLGVRI